jgi:hypothetical protein
MRWSAASVLALLVVLVASATARGDVVDDNPAASSRGPGEVSVFIRGPGADLQVAELSNGSFTPWTSLGGVLTSGPGASGRTTQITDTFVRGGDNGMWFKAWVAGSGWRGYSGLGGSVLSAPGVAYRSNGGYIDFYYRGSDNGVVARSYVPGSGWTAENATALAPGRTLSAPALLARTPNVLEVIVRGTDDGVYRNWWNGSAWSGWIGIPGITTTHAPALARRVNGTMDLFVRTPSGGVGWSSFDGVAFSAWKTVPGSVDSGLAAVSDHPDRIYLFARRGTEVVWNLYDRGAGPEQGWRGWQPLHPPPPPPGCDPAAGRLTGHSRTVAYGKSPVVSGRVRRTDGAPMPESVVTVSSGTGSWSRTGIAAVSGIYKVKIPAGPTRTLRLQAHAPGATALACTTATVRTRAGVRLKASKRVRPGGRVRFRGRVLGKPIPGRGKLVELQAFDGGRWRVFATPRTNRKGTFKTSYKLRRTFGPRTFRFRARIRKETGHPYELGYSRRVKVRVR